MTPVADIMDRCRAAGVELVADGQRLRFRPVALVDDALRDALRLHKSGLLSTLAASVSAAVADRFDGGDVEQRQERPLVGPRLSDKHFGLQQGDAVRVVDGERLAPGREDAEGVERVAVEQFDDRVPCAHTQSIAADGPDGQGAAIAYRPPEQHDAADVAVIEGYRGLREVFTATSGTPAEPVEGVPDGWTRDSWTRRLEYLIGVCVIPERREELRRMLEKVR